MHQSLFSIYKKLWNLSLILNFDRMGLAIISSNGSAVLFAMGIIAQVPAAHRALSKTTTPWEAAAVAEDEAALITTGTAADRRHLQPPGGANQIWKSTVHQVKPNSFFSGQQLHFGGARKRLLWPELKKNLLTGLSWLYQNLIVLDILGYLESRSLPGELGWKMLQEFAVQTAFVVVADIVFDAF